MADDLDLTEMLRRAVQANVKFYQGWLDLSLDYVRGISDIFAASAGSGDPVGSSEGMSDAGVLVLEGEDGTAAQGAFLVTNDLSRKVSCRLGASEFTDSDGKVVRPKVTFEPEAFELMPGEQQVVQASLVLDGKLTAGYGYQGEFAIKGMEGTSVPVVLRRRHRVDELSEVPSGQTKAEAEPAATARKAPARKKAAKRSTKKATANEKASTGETAAKKRAPRKRVARQKS